MSSRTATYNASEFGAMSIPAAAFETLGYLIVVAAATLFFVAGGLSINVAVVLTVVLLASLIVLSWIHLGQGQHPVFLFLCTLMLFQGGRLIGYCLGVESDPLRITAMDSDFVLNRLDQGVVLLCISMSAICIYAPSRLVGGPAKWAAPIGTRRFLPYLYSVFLLSVPVMLFKSYRYYQYAKAHGGYFFLYVNHDALAASVPLWVRLVSAMAIIPFVSLIVVETRRRFIILVMCLYFGCSLPALLLGSRMPTFSLALSLFYVLRVKSEGKFRVRNLIVVVAALMLAASFFGMIRSDFEMENGFILPVHFTSQQGISLNVTEVVVRDPEVFRPYRLSYLYNEIQSAFVASGAYNYSRGRMWDADVSNFLDARLYRYGFGVGGSYIAEAYAYWGFIGVLVVSIIVGAGLALLAKYSRTPFFLIIAAITLPDIFLMPRGALLTWVSILARSSIALLLLAIGWQIYSSLLSIRHTELPSAGGTPAGPAA